MGKLLFIILWCTSLHIILTSSSNIDQLVKNKSSSTKNKKEPLILKDNKESYKNDLNIFRHFSKEIQELNNQLKYQEGDIAELLREFNLNFENLVELYLDQLQDQYAKTAPKKRVNRSKRELNLQSVLNATNHHHVIQNFIPQQINNSAFSNIKEAPIEKDLLDLDRMGYDSTEDQSKRDPLIRMNDSPPINTLQMLMKETDYLNNKRLKKPEKLNELMSKVQAIEDNISLINTNLSQITQSLNYIVSKFRLFRIKSKNQEYIEKQYGNCYDLLKNGYNRSGVYEVKPNNYQFLVYCDMELKGGGWAYIHNRFDGSQEFMQNYNSYKIGFGNLAGEFWLGLEKIYALAGSQLNELLIELTDSNNNKAYAYYDSFSIGSETEGYPLKVLGGFSGEAGDSLKYHAGCKFSTIDMDQDEWPEGNCAKSHNGAWWYRSCDTSNLNGKYLNGSLSDNLIYQGMYWNGYQGPKYSLSSAKMMIRPRRQSYY